MNNDLTIVALIPARAGSKRVANKNIRLLDNHPLMAYTISSARASGVFKDIIVSTDSDLYIDIARYYGAEVPFKRPVEMAGEYSPDIEWIKYTLKCLEDIGRNYDCFSILRPTNPFRRPETIQRAWQDFNRDNTIDSLRAVERCSQHPGKMWIIQERQMVPVLPFKHNGTPWHSSPYQVLPEVFIQNASLEIAYCSVVTKQNSISGSIIKPFITNEYEGFDINNEIDWKVAEALVKEGSAHLPIINELPYQHFLEGK